MPRVLGLQNNKISNCKNNYIFALKLIKLYY